MPHLEHLRTARRVANLQKGRNDWFKFTKNKAEGTTELYIYDEIGWFGITASDLVQELQSITDSSITVRLNTPGGDAFDGIAIMNALKSHPATVDIVVDALAASAGSIIAMAGDTITMMTGSQMMIHNASGLVIGNAVDMRDMAGLLDKMDANIASIYQSRVGGDLQDWKDAMAAETWYDANEAVAAGLADEVDSGDSKNTKNDWDLRVFAYAGREHAPAPKIAAHSEPSFEFDPDAFRQIMKEVAAG